MNKIKNLRSKLLAFHFLPFVFCLLFISPFLTLAQEGEPPEDVAPPPFKFLSKVEKTSLESQNNNIKKRTKLSLELMDARMLKAEKSQVENNYSSSLEELAGFHAILDNTLDYLIKTNAGKNDRSFINFEIYLRKQVPRLESIRREMPVRYGYYVGKLMIAVREARAKAVEPIFRDSVIPNASKKP